MKKLITLSILVVAFLALAVAPALAEGYNDSGTYTRANGYFQGPHGGYSTTTNKCTVCHATHYAQGSYMLLRANSREAACDYCHGGGGGSTINVQMDNDYRSGTYSVAQASAVETTTMGLGTGHTLGYSGNAPADIKPAYTSANGFACFDCHSPHGNSARIMTTFSAPGRAFVGPGQEGRPTTAALNGQTEKWPIQLGFGGDKNANGLLDDNEWGVDSVYGNFVWDRSATVGTMLFTYRPIWPSGRFLLLKDPHSTAAEGQADTVVAGLNELATNGVNKYKIDWAEPLGPADGNYGGYQDNDNDNNFPFAPKQTVDTDGNGELDGGFLSQSEFCVDCHDGTAGASTQSAEVWRSSDSTYAVAYSHDAQPRH